MMQDDRSDLITAAVRAARVIVADARQRGHVVCDALIDGETDDDTLLLALDECAEAADVRGARCAGLWLRLTADEREEAHGHLCDEDGHAST